MKTKVAAIATLAVVALAFFATPSVASPCVPAPPRTTCVAVTFEWDQIPQPFAYVYSQAAAGEAPRLYGVSLSASGGPPKYEQIAAFDLWTSRWVYSYHGINGTSPFYAVLPALTEAVKRGR